MAVGAAIAASAIGGIAQASSASRAAGAQTDAANRQLELQRQIYEDTVARQEPFYSGGLSANDAYLYELGLGPQPMIGATPLTVTEVPGVTQQAFGRTTPTLGFGGAEGSGGVTSNAGTTTTPTRWMVDGQYFDTQDAANAYAQANATGGTPYAGYQATPSFQNALDVGTKQLDRTAASRGMALSGNTIKAQTDFATNLALNDYNNYLNRLSGAAASGQNAASGLAAAGQNYASGASNALSGIGNAQAAGAIGVGNSINSGISNALGAYQYGQLLNAYQNRGIA